MTSLHDTNPAAFAEIMTTYANVGDRVLDATWDRGVFWKDLDALGVLAYDRVTNDLHKSADYAYEFQSFPQDWASSFDVVVFDPPYKLNGGTTNSSHYTTQRYGNLSMNYQLVPKYYEEGCAEVHRILRPGGIMVLKTQDQVVSGKFMFLTNLTVTNWCTMFDRMVDEIIVKSTPRKQPDGRRQVHIRAGHSTFQVWVK